MRNKFSKNRSDLFASKIDLKKYQDYRQQNGKERAQGYFDALADVNENLEEIFYYFEPRLKAEKESSPHKVKASIKLFRSQLKILIDEIKTQNAEPNTLDTTNDNLSI